MKTQKKSCFCVLTISLMTALVLIANCPAGQPAPAQQPEPNFKYQINNLSQDQSLQIQQQRLSDIKNVAEDERLKIEKWYSTRLAELQLQTEDSIQKLKLSNRVIWTEFLRVHRQLAYSDNFLEIGDAFKSDTYILYPAPTILTNLETRKLLGKILFIYSNGIIPDFLYEQQDFEQGLKSERVTDVLSVSQIRKVDMLYEIMKKFDSDLARLEHQRQVKLSDLDQWEKNQTENALAIINQIRTPAKKTELGIVTAICFDKEAFCMIDGAEEPLLKTGSMVNGIKVSKIHPDKVEFSKGPKAWSQKIGEPANSAWF